MPLRALLAPSAERFHLTKTPISAARSGMRPKRETMTDATRFSSIWPFGVEAGSHSTEACYEYRGLARTLLLTTYPWESGDPKV